MSVRLQEVLSLLDYSQAKQPHHQSNLIHAIQQFAELQGDIDLEVACHAEIKKIHAVSNTDTSVTDLQPTKLMVAVVIRRLILGSEIHDPTVSAVIHDDGGERLPEETTERYLERLADQYIIDFKKQFVEFTRADFYIEVISLQL